MHTTQQIMWQTQPSNVAKFSQMMWQTQLNDVADPAK
jgi:hypothetical protein